MDDLSVRFPSTIQSYQHFTIPTFHKLRFMPEN